MRNNLFYYCSLKNISLLAKLTSVSIVSSVRDHELLLHYCFPYLLLMASPDFPGLPFYISFLLGHIVIYFPFFNQ